MDIWNTKNTMQDLADGTARSFDRGTGEALVDCIKVDPEFSEVVGEYGRLGYAVTLVEHIESLRVFNEIECVAESTTIAFMPNPRGPFYRIDATHVLQYTFKTLKGFLLTRREWAYQIKRSRQ